MASYHTGILLTQLLKIKCAGKWMEKNITLIDVTQTPNKEYGVFPSYVGRLGKQARVHMEIHIRCTIRD